VANKNFDFYVRYIDPEEVQRTTPAKRLERKAGPYSATSVNRALSKFYADVADKPEGDMPAVDRKQLWLKRDFVILDVMRSPAQVGEQWPEDADD
jgi:hypothetical protein